MLSKLFTLAAFGALAAGMSIPRDYCDPTADGLPKPNDQQKRAIAKQAGGLLPNSPPPAKLGAGSTTALQLIAFNELFEIAYFSSLLHNVSSNVHGYETPNKAELVQVIGTVRAQEEQHALGAISFLENAKEFAPSSCKYQFPVSDLKTAISVAETLTSVVLGALQGANTLFAADGIPELIQIFSSVIGQEGEQNGFYHTYLRQIPSDSPFLTPVPAPFAFSALQGFVVPGSCPFPLSKIALPILPGLNANGGPIAFIDPKDQTISFTSADLSGNSKAHKYIGGDGKGLYLTWTTGQQVPFSVPIKDVHWEGSTISFKADFPYAEHVMDGFSHGALTTSNKFASSDAVVDATLAAPAVIQALKTLA